MAQHIMDLFEDKARAGDGQYAIAYALMESSRVQKDIAYQLSRLGLADAATPMGAMEALGVSLEKGLDGVASAITETAKAITEASEAQYSQE